MWYPLLAMSEDFRDWLSDKLVSLDWTQSELARRAGITQGTISRVLTGERQPGPDFINAISKAMRLDPAVVFAQAGMLPIATGKDASIEALATRLAKLTTHDREVIVSVFLDIVDLLIKDQQS